MFICTNIHSIIQFQIRLQTNCREETKLSTTKKAQDVKLKFKNFGWQLFNSKLLVLFIYLPNVLKPFSRFDVFAILVLMFKNCFYKRTKPSSSRMNNDWKLFDFFSSFSTLTTCSYSPPPEDLAAADDPSHSRSMISHFNRIWQSTQGEVRLLRVQYCDRAPNVLKHDRMITRVFNRAEIYGPVAWMFEATSVKGQSIWTQTPGSNYKRVNCQC